METIEHKLTGLQRIKTNEKTINILLLGPPGQGKSALANSFYRYVTEDLDKVHPCTTAANRRGTYRFGIVPKLEEMCNIRIFDIPGVSLTTSNVQKILDGIPLNTHIDDIDAVGVDANNRVDFVIVVYSLLELENCSGLFGNVFPSLQCPKNWIPHDVFVMIEKHTHHLPMLILTHSDQKKLKNEKYMPVATEPFPSDQIYFVSNYLGGDNIKIQTNVTLEEILLRILVKMGCI